jgi:hypothetical protein
MLVAKICIMVAIIGKVRCFGILFLAGLCRFLQVGMLRDVDANYAKSCHV